MMMAISLPTWANTRVWIWMAPMTKTLKSLWRRSGTILQLRLQRGRREREDGLGSNHLWKLRSTRASARTILKTSHRLLLQKSHQFQMERMKSTYDYDLWHHLQFPQFGKCWQRTTHWPQMRRGEHERRSGRRFEDLRLMCSCPFDYVHVYFSDTTMATSRVGMVNEHTRVYQLS
jgi:hypothetical protein